MDEDEVTNVMAEHIAEAVDKRGKNDRTLSSIMDDRHTLKVRPPETILNKPQHVNAIEFINFKREIIAIIKSSEKYVIILGNPPEIAYPQYYDNNERYHPNPIRIKKSFQTECSKLHNWLLSCIHEDVARSISNKLDVTLQPLGKRLQFDPQTEWVTNSSLFNDSPVDAHAVWLEIESRYNRPNPFDATFYRERLTKLNFNPSYHPDNYMDTYKSIMHEARRACKNFVPPTTHEMYSDYYRHWPSVEPYMSALLVIQTEADRNGVEPSVKDMKIDMHSVIATPQRV